MIRFRWDFLDDVLKKVRFCGNKWCDCIQNVKILRGFHHHKRSPTEDLILQRAKARTKVEATCPRVQAWTEIIDKVNKVSKYASRTCWRDIKNEVRSLKDQELTCVILCILKWAMGEQRKIWDDILRLASKPLKLLFPRIYALDNIKDATICMKLNEPQHFIITSDRIIEEEIAHSQFKELTDLLIPIVLNPCPDRWFWSLEGSGEFSVASIRRFIDDQRLLTMILKLFGLKVSRLR
ncbi:hypothetical protein Tco_0762516 [Tanacetum coccineum]